MNFDVFLPPAAHRSTLPVCVKSARLLQRQFDLLSIKNSISCSHKYPEMTPVCELRALLARGRSN